MVYELNLDDAFLNGLNASLIEPYLECESDR